LLIYVILSSNMSISYEEALETLESMFGESWTRENLDAVLRHQQGHMENTVDMILRHGDKDPQILIDQLAAGIDPEESARNMDEALARQLSQGMNLPVDRTMVSSTQAKKGRGTPTTLPDDFLRIPGGFTVQNLADDEALARMLQDELFSQELARNPEFAHLARGRPGAAPALRAGEARRSFTARGGNPPQFQPHQIMDKISELGDNARRRLQLMAAQFNAARNANQGQQGSTASTERTSPAAAERRGLLDDMDDMELAARKDL
jgi:hypothetical protein